MSQLWICKLCFTERSNRKSLFLHVKVKHALHASVKPLPCLYTKCMFSFRTLTSLTSHMSRHHPVGVDGEVAHSNLSCSYCGSLSVSVKSYLAHLRTHVRNHETVACPFWGCLFMSNVVDILSVIQHHNSVQS